MYGASILYAFEAGAIGEWSVTSAITLRGDTLPDAQRLTIRLETEPASARPDPVWRLRGAASHLRYTLRREAERLSQKGGPLGRPEARCAALIPIRKNETWWSLAQDERRAIYEERSRHTSIGMEYLPAIARRLHHSRDLGEPFDFLTWFEFGRTDTAAFDELLGRLREREEWLYVDREIDIRLQRTGA